ncbi:MAG: hypothetical protein VB108_06465 [Anaerolineaceae bacterium]|nr:hypothetical protein [Anaerolineaceae bacterium]
MPKPNKWVVWTLLLLAVLFFCIYLLPNRSASLNRAMVSMFEPDEGAIYDVVERMTLPRGRWDEQLLRFILYDFYHYGFPFFGLAGLTALPLRFTGQFGNTPALMLAMRQMISVLPSLLAILLLVYLQDRFSSWRSIALFLLLNLLPGIVRNNLWLHPDGLAFFLTVLVIYFLWRDRMQFKKYFYLAAFACGFLIATKLIGVYFFLTIATLLILGIVRKEISFKQALGKGLLFILVMGLGVMAANPFVFDRHALFKYARTFLREMKEITKGYGLVYSSGIAAALKPMQQAYGHLLFILLSFLAMLYGVFRAKDRHLYIILLTWFIPLSAVVLFISHFKYQYWLPAFVPACSALYLLLPGNTQLLPKQNHSAKPLLYLASALILLQASFFVPVDYKILQSKIHLAEGNLRILFYENALKTLSPLLDQEVHVYYDYRLYMPQTGRWWLDTSFDMLQYDFIEEGSFDALLLLKQRILDYLNPNATAVDADQLAVARVFYNDAASGTIKNYVLLYEDAVGKVFVKKDVCYAWFPAEQCK